MDSGKKNGAVFGLALAILAAVAAAQTPWTKIAQSEDWAPDRTWGPGNHGNSRLASDGTKKLFLSQGGSLYVGENQGTSWKVAATGAENGSAMAAPVAAAAGWVGTVLWGSWVSQNGGAIWTMPDTSRKSLNTGFGFTLRGRVLAGDANGGISLSDDDGRSWRPVFSAAETRPISGFVSFVSWSFAVSGPDRILASRNDGEDWADLASFLVPDSGTTEMEGPKATFLALDNKPYTHTLWSLEAAAEGGEAVVSEYVGNYRDSLLSARRIKSERFPDSAVTAFVTTDGHRWPSPPTLWVGTWGQGIWISRDNGLTWNPRNAGIGDLHVEAICVTGDGWNRPLYALTRDGLYRLDQTVSAVTAISPIRRNGTSPARAESGRSGSLFQPDGPGREGLFRADGRKASLRLPATAD